MKKFFLTLRVVFIFFILNVCSPAFSATLHVLSPMRMLDPKLIAQFEKANECQVDVEFVSDSKGYESHLRSEIHIFDVVIADELSLIQLTTTNLLRSLPERLRQNNQSSSPLRVKTAFNSEVNTYVPLFVNPLGIAYNDNVSTISKTSTWNVLIEPDKNPYWRQHIYMPREEAMQVAISLFAAHEPFTNPKKLPDGAKKWLSKARAQRALIDDPLEVALLGQHVNAAVIFYADYLNYKNLNSQLKFFVPNDGTYFDRYGIGWCLSSTQEKLAKAFIEFMIANSEKFAKSNHLIGIGENLHKHNVTQWTLYDESAVLPFLPSQGLGQ